MFIKTIPSSSQAGYFSYSHSSLSLYFCCIIIWNKVPIYLTSHCDDHIYIYNTKVSPKRLEFLLKYIPHSYELRSNYFTLYFIVVSFTLCKNHGNSHTHSFINTFLYFNIALFNVFADYNFCIESVFDATLGLITFCTNVLHKY